MPVGVFRHSEWLSPHQLFMLDELHARKIDLADYILVLNIDGYIGSSTKTDIEYAQAQGKRVEYLEQPCL